MSPPAQSTSVTNLLLAKCNVEWGRAGCSSLHVALLRLQFPSVSLPENQLVIYGTVGYTFVEVLQAFGDSSRSLHPYSGEGM